MKNYKNTIFIYCFLAAAIPLILTAALAFRIYVEETKKQSDLNMQTVGKQVTNDVENVLSQIRSYYVESCTQEDVAWLGKATKIPYSQYSYLESAQKALSGSAYLLDYISGYAYINIKEEWILTNNGMFPMEELKEPALLEEYLLKASKIPSAIYWDNRLTETSPFGNGPRRSKVLDLTGLRLVIKPSNASRKTNQLLTVKLNFPSLQQLALEGRGEYDICILSEDGESLLCTDDTFLSYCRESFVEFSKVSDGAVQEIKLSDKRSFRMSMEKSEESGMYYIIGYDAMKATRGGLRILGAAGAVLVAVAVLVLSCRLISTVLYRPVGMLDRYVADVTLEASENGEESPKADEFARIREKVSFIVNEKAGMQGLIKEQRSILLEQFLVRAVRGEMVSQEILNVHEKLGLESYKYYRMLAYTIIVDKETETENDLGEEAVCLMAVRRMPEALRKKLAAPPFCYEGRILTIIGDSEEEALIPKAEELNSSLEGYIRENFGLVTAGGVSQSFPKLKYLRTACNECMEALHNTSDSGKEGLVYYEKIAGNDGILGGYDFLLESAVIKAVNNGSREEAAELSDKFVNSLNNRCIRNNDRSLYLHRLTVAIMSVLTDAGLSMNQVYGEDPEEADPFIRINYLYESDKLKEYLEKKILLPAMEALYRYRYESSGGILRQVIDLIRETKGDITMGECAERLNYHPSYIWKVLKAERDITFTDLVNEEKLALAKQLLLKSNSSIDEIAQTLKYASTQSFIRFFSKYEQTTPGKYRKEHGKYKVH